MHIKTFVAIAILLLTTGQSQAQHNGIEVQHNQRELLRDRLPRQRNVLRDHLLLWGKQIRKWDQRIKSGKLSRSDREELEKKRKSAFKNWQAMKQRYDEREKTLILKRKLDEVKIPKHPI